MIQLKLVLFIIFIHNFFLFGNDLKTDFEKSNGNTTPTYPEVITYYQQLDSASDWLTMTEIGMTDIGKPLHVVKLSNTASKKEKLVVLINNGIHPGEACGIDASMLLARDFISDQKLNVLLDNIELYIIPVLNVGGALNRNSNTRVNQKGPESYGFRGNAQHLDLNRDFVKVASKNIQSFIQLFHQIKPHLIIDTHTSNGADYQHAISYIATHPDKLAPDLQNFWINSFLPTLERKMDNSYPLIPYVQSLKTTPDSGIVSFMDDARYSTGYASLFNTLGIMSEAHMLKDYSTRTKSTHQFLKEILFTAHDYKDSIIDLKAIANRYVLTQENFYLEWKLDTSKHTMISYKGYDYKKKRSSLTGEYIHFYINTDSVEMLIPYYDRYTPHLSITKPKAYVIPQAWTEVIEKLNCHQVTLDTIKKDTALTLEVYYIKDYYTFSYPYEGHYIHKSVKVQKDTQTVTLYAGDVVVNTNQTANQLIVTALEPQSEDSYFCWNEFDPILQRKESFSSYLFEPTAKEVLNNNADLKKDYRDFRTNLRFPNNHKLLEFILERSEYLEKNYKRYPVYRVIN